MRNCNDYKQMLVSFVYGEITPEEERELFQHLSSCPSCRNDLRELLEARQLLSRLEKPSSSPPPITLVVQKSGFLPWAAVLLIGLLSLFIMGVQIRVKDTTISLSTVNTAQVIDELRYDFERRTYELEERIQDAELYIDELLSEIENLTGGEK